MHEADRSTPRLGTPRSEPTVVQGFVLAMMAWLTVIASGILSPVLPKIAAHFAAEPHIELKVGLVATMPALAVALLALGIGRLGDGLGHRRVLLIGLIAYGIAGVAPFWIESLDAIILSRLLVGIGEAAAMSMSIALLVMLFDGAQRRRWLAIQVASANVMGVLTLFAGGFIGRLSWRGPFLAYSFSLLLFLLAVLFVRQPARATSRTAVHARPTWPELRAVGVKCALLMVVTLSIAVIIVQLVFLLAERGIHDSGALGLGIGASAGGIAVGATLAGALVRAQPRRLLSLGYALIGTGFIVMAQPLSAGLTIAFGAVAGLGCGLAIPSLLAATMAEARPAIVGTLSGLWTMAMFIGQFCSPPVILLLKSLTGTLASAILIVGVAAAVLSIIVQVTGLGVARPATASAS